MAMSQSSSGNGFRGIALLSSCSAVFCCGVALFCRAAGAQELMQPSTPGGEVRLFNSDSAILESTENRKDLPCTVTPVKPSLGFDMKFHGGYDVQTPLKELAGTENQLTMVFRVIPEGHSDSPVYFKQHYSVPAIDDNAGGSAYLQWRGRARRGQISRRLADARSPGTHLLLPLGRRSLDSAAETGP